MGGWSLPEKGGDVYGVFNDIRSNPGITNNVVQEKYKIAAPA